MIELAMVRRMALRAVVISPLLLGGLWLLGGPVHALSGGVGLLMTLANLWLSARIIGGIADSNPGLLLAAGMAAFALGLALLTGIALLLQRLDLVLFPVTGFVLVGGHLILVLWEASGAYGRVGPGTGDGKARGGPARAESRS